MGSFCCDQRHQGLVLAMDSSEERKATGEFRDLEGQVVADEVDLGRLGTRGFGLEEADAAKDVLKAFGNVSLFPFGWEMKTKTMTMTMIMIMRMTMTMRRRDANRVHHA